VNVPQPIKTAYSSHVASLFLMFFTLLLIWLSATGKLKNILSVFSGPSLTGEGLSTPSSVSAASSNPEASSGPSGSLSANESLIRKALRAAGFDPQGVNTMVAIGKAESGLRSNATLSTSREYSVGPFQINLKAHPNVSEEAARDPYQASAYAYQLSGGGKNYSPWTTYTSGKYKRYLP
jgi:hypothetical protein